jgi:hypothetical protein
MGPVPVRIEIDREAGEAAWVSMLGIEQLRLSDRVAPRRTVA